MGKKIYFSLFFILTGSMAYAQCSGGTGSPIIYETFGSGTSVFGPPLHPGTTNFMYLQSECPDDGQYAIVNYTTGCYNAWHTLTDHTGDPNGYFMIANAAYAPSDFFVQTVRGLCPGSTYKFSAWLINMEFAEGLIKPNITFTIEQTDGTILGSYDTGDIPVINPVQWTQYGFYFTTPAGVTTVKLRMHNNAPGGGGNDVGLDDISFAPSGPETVIGVNGTKGDTVHNSCHGEISLYSTVGACYVNNSYQWQISADAISWTDITGANSPNYIVNPQNSGTYFYRLLVAETGNTGSARCRVNSNFVCVIYHQYGQPKFKNISASICAGTFYTLPSGRIVDSTGSYTDTLSNKQGCDSLYTVLNLTVGNIPELGEAKLLCAGDSLILSPGYFSHYIWQDGSIAPTLKVTSAGTYWVTVIDENGCESADTIKIKESYCSLIKPPNAFTPNGDGINDTWNIKGLQYFPHCTIFVYTRWGQLVFKSIGYGKPWDGKNKGKDLPVGAYYYVINLTSNSPPISGFVTIIK